MWGRLFPNEVCRDEMGDYGRLFSLVQAELTLKITLRIAN